MYCLKCGRDTVANNIFCEECLNTMEQYPVKPGTAIQLPQRTTKTAIKKPAKRGPSHEEQIARLKRSRRRLMLLAALLFVALCVSLFVSYAPKKAPAATDTTTAVTTQPQTENTTVTTQAETESTTAAATQPQTETTLATEDVSRETSVD